MNRAHLSGVVHGNLKPSNLLVRDNGEDQWDAWATEFGLWKMKAYVSIGEEEGNPQTVTSNLEVQESTEKSVEFRPEKSTSKEIPSERWDLHAMGKVVKWIIEMKKIRVEPGMVRLDELG